MDNLEAARLGLQTLDLTTLADDDTDDRISELCRRANTAHGSTAAICIYPRFVPYAKHTLAEMESPVRVATVCVFPHGRPDVEMAIAETRACVAYGADEVDTVLPYREFARGDEAVCRDQLKAVREACGSVTMKVILETGELTDAALIGQASQLAIDCGADFIKTSTGKVPTNATLEAAEAMLEVIAAAPRQVGLKIAGGVRTTDDARRYLELAESKMGRDYLCPTTFRFGASGLLDALIAELEGETPATNASDY